MSSQGAGATAGNPQLLICDSDAVIQLFISNTVKVLREIKRAYGTQPVITPEVENELRTLPKYAKRIDASLTKAITNQTLLVLSQHALTQVVGKSAATFYPAIQALGAKYALVVHPGEAYSHAAAVTLASPVLSHDMNAIRTLQGWVTQLAHQLSEPSTYWFWGSEWGIYKRRSVMRFDTRCPSPNGMSGYRKRFSMYRSQMD